MTTHNVASSPSDSHCVPSGPKVKQVRHHCILKSCHARVNNGRRGSYAGRVTDSTKRKYSFVDKLCYNDDNIHYDSWHASCQRMIMRDNSHTQPGNEQRFFNLVYLLMPCGCECSGRFTGRTSIEKVQI